MMEQDFEPKTSSMKTNSTQHCKEIFNDSFFIRKPITSGALNKNERSVFHSLKDNSDSYTNRTHNKADHENSGSKIVCISTPKTLFMKKIVRNHFVIAIALVIANLFFTRSGFSQTPITLTFNNNSSFTVPSGVTSVTVEAWGGGGGG